VDIWRACLSGVFQDYARLELTAREFSSALLARGGTYAELFSLQARAYG
jgi:hypothetical protein